MNDFDENHRYCKDCLVPTLKTELSGGRCVRCVSERRIALDRESRNMVRREVAEASRNFVAQLAKMNDESAMMPQLIASFLEAHGEGDQTKGLQKLGKDLKEDFDRVRGSGLTEEELKFHDFKPGVALKFHQLITDTIRRSDESKTVDVANMTDQDLSSALVDVAVTQMLSDEDMQAKVLARLFQAKPELRAEIMEMNGRPVIEPRVPNPIPVLDYDESTGDE